MIITVAGTKGGVGKSLMSCQLASYWHCQGLRTAILDLDVQGTARRFADAAEQTNNSCPTTLAVSGDVGKTLREMDNVYDLLVCDTQGRANAMAAGAIVRSDVVLAPCGPTSEDLDALATATMDILEQAKAIREDLPVLIVRNQWPSRATAMSTAIDQALLDLGIPIAKTALSRLVAYNEAAAAGTCVTNLAPRSPAAKNLRELATEIERFLGIDTRTEEVVAHA